MNVVIIDKNRYMDQSSLGDVYHMLKSTDFCIVVDYDNNSFWYVKNRVTGITGSIDAKHSLTELSNHLESIKRYYDASNQLQKAIEELS